MKKLIWIFFLFPSMYFAQQSLVDSLLNALKEIETKDRSGEGYGLKDVPKVKILYRISSEYYYIGKFDSSMVYALKTKKLATELASVLKGEDRKRAFTTITNALNIMGILYDQNGDYPKALEHYFESLKIKQQIGEERSASAEYDNIGTVYYYMKDYKHALEYYVRSNQVATKYNDEESIATSLRNQATVYERMKEYTKSIELDAKALIIRKRLGYKNQIASSMSNIAIMFAINGEKAKSLALSLRALEIQQEIEDVDGMIQTYMNMGEIYSDLIDEAPGLKAPEPLKFKGDSLFVINEVQNKELINITRVEKIKRAGDYLGKALKLAKQAQIKEHLKQCYGDLYAFYKKTGEDKASLENYKLFAEYKDSLLNEENTRTAVRVEMKYEIDKKETQIKLLNKEAELKQAELKSFRTNIFAGSAVLLLISGSAFFYVRNKRRNEKIIIEKQVVELEQQALRLQMNPHFIFNSLSSINNFIGKNETAEAKKFLTKFSKLMRLILENSREAFVSLQSEIDSLKYYMELEQLRFNNKFSFEIITDSGLDTENTFIPPMLIQPHIENAILHGIKPKPTNGKILISFTSQNQNVLCAVSDDGVGRKRSAEIKMAEGFSHRSMAMEVTRARLQIFNMGGEIVVQDLQDNDGNATGTKIIFEIPAKQN